MTAADRPAPATGCWSSTSPPAGPATTSWPGPRPVRHPQGRPRRHARPDGHRGARARHQPGHPAADLPRRLRQGLHRDHPAGAATLTDDAEGEVTAAYDVVVGDRRRTSRRPSPSSPATSRRCRARSARSRSTASAPTPGSAPARTSSSRPGRSRCTGSTCWRRRGGRGRRPGRARPRRRGRRCPRAPTSAPWPATSAPPSASAATSPRCGAPGSARSTSTSAHRPGGSSQAARDTGDGVPVMPLADAARAQFAVRELTEAEATAVGFGQRIDSSSRGATEPVAAFAPDGAPGGHARRVAVTIARPHVVFAPLGFVECPPCIAGRTSPRPPRASARRGDARQLRRRPPRPPRPSWRGRRGGPARVGVPSGRGDLRPAPGRRSSTPTRPELIAARPPA